VVNLLNRKPAVELHRNGFERAAFDLPPMKTNNILEIKVKIKKSTLVTMPIFCLTATTL
jgi:hypothetical protein